MHVCILVQRKRMRLSGKLINQASRNFCTNMLGINFYYVQFFQKKIYTTLKSYIPSVLLDLMEMQSVKETF